LEAGTPHLYSLSVIILHWTANFLTQDISSSRSLHLDLESLASLDDADLTRLHVQHAEFSLDVERTLLGYDQKVAIRVHNGLALHAGVGQERVDSKSLA
jgi:hypothetical protein